MDHTTTAESQHKNKHRLYESLGQIYVLFEALEQGINKLVMCCLGECASKNLMLLDRISFGEKAALMDELIRSIHSKQELSELNDTLIALVDRCNLCEELGDKWMQAHWVPEVEAGEGVVMRLERDTANNLQLVPCRLNELENFVIVLNATNAYLSRFHQTLAAKKRIRHIPLLTGYVKPLPLANGAVV
jgi:hypothetical protein